MGLCFFSHVPGPNTLHPLIHINTCFTMISNFIYFWIPLIWEPISLGEKHRICIKARKFIRVEHWNEPYTFTYQKANHV